MVQPLPTKPIVLYDGVCGLCNRLVQFILKRDQRNVFQFASLQNNFARDVLQRHGANPDDLDTVYVVVNHDQPGERLLDRSDAILFMLNQLGSIWKLVTVGKILPKGLQNTVYGLVARNRYRMFGKYDTCMLPDPKDKDKFLDV